MDYENLACKLRSMLNIEAEMLERWQFLSSGERKRWQIGAAINTECDILLLDEPTNHLDLQSTEHLEAALKAFPGTLILVSHDSVFAEVCTEREVEVTLEEKFSILQ